MISPLGEFSGNVELVNFTGMHNHHTADWSHWCYDFIVTALRIAVVGAVGARRSALSSILATERTLLVART